MLTRMKLFRAVFVLVWVFLAAGGEAADSSLLERAKNLYSVQDYNNALTLFEKVLQEEPENGEAWDYASWCHRYLGNWKQANSGFMEAEKFLPGALAKWVKVGRGETYLSGGLGYSAIEAFSQAIALAPDDDELVARSMKGIVFANASLGDQPKTEEAMGKLKEKYPETAAEIESDTAVILERNKRPEPVVPSAPPADPVSEDIGDEETPPEVTPPVTEPGESGAEGDAPGLNDTEDRRKKEAEAWLAGRRELQSGTEGQEAETPSSGDQPPAEQPVEKQPVEKQPEAVVTIWDLPVGGDMETVMAWLGEKGIEVQKNEEPTKLGSWFYTVKFPGESGEPDEPDEPDEYPLPELARRDADSTLYTLEEFQGKLLSVMVSSTWRERKNIISLKDELFKKTSENLSGKYGVSASLSDNGIFAETCWLSGEELFIALSATASLDGQVVMNVSLSDLPGLNVFWEHADRFNAEQSVQEPQEQQGQ